MNNSNFIKSPLGLKTGKDPLPMFFDKEKEQEVKKELEKETVNSEEKQDLSSEGKLVRLIFLKL
jgi:hypothetical protein